MPPCHAAGVQEKSSPCITSGPSAPSFVVIRYTPDSPIRNASSVPAGTTCTPRVYSRMVCSNSSLFTP